ncbi:MAG: V-type ATPase 116kDa subunit family protein [Candidatus Micrarchaeaceae archaeon]
MLPEKMEKVRLIVKKDYASLVLEELYELGLVQIEPLGESAKKAAVHIEAKEHEKVVEYAKKFNSLESMLYKKECPKVYEFGNLDELFEYADSISIFDRVLELKNAIDEIEAHKAVLNDNIRIVKSIKWYSKDLRTLSNADISSFIVYTGRKELEINIREKISNIIAINGNGPASIIAIEKKNEGIVAEILSKNPKIYAEHMPQLSGTPAQAEMAIRHEIEEIDIKEKILKKDLDAISKEYYGNVAAIAEQFGIELEKIEALEKLGSTNSVAFLEGWMPKKMFMQFDKKMNEATKGMYVLESITSKDDVPPTKLINGPATKIFEFFIRFYSLPKGNEIDPTLAFAFLFPIFFGIMIGDAGYGITMIGISAFMLHMLKTKKAIKNKLVGRLARFATTVLSKNTMYIIAKAIIPGAIVAIALGILFNQWFGFQLPYAPIFDIETNITKLLFISGLIGTAIVIAGFALGIANELILGEKRRALGKLGWIMLAIGIVAFGISVLYKIPIGINLETIASLVSAFAGIALVLFGDKASNLLELPSMISHILSYTRLIGILLASVILAQVINYMFLHAIRHSLPLVIGGFIILFAGQAFNIAIALFEPGIQGARLIYVEFFSNFFSGNGKEFRPFASKRKITKRKI